jgi:hypothetical protein
MNEEYRELCIRCEEVYGTAGEHRAIVCGDCIKKVGAMLKKLNKGVLRHPRRRLKDGPAC